MDTQITTKLLLDDKPLVLLPQLAVVVGVEEAIILQQIHFLCGGYKSGVTLDDGEKYVWNTYEDWHKDVFPFWSVATIKRKFAHLESLNLLVSCKPKSDKYDHTKYYRVNTEELAKLNRINEPIDSIKLSQSDGSNCDDRADQIEPILKGTKTSSKTSAERTRAQKTDVSEEARVESIGEVEHITRAEKKEEKEKNAIAVRPAFAAEPKSVQIAREFYPTFEPRNEYQRKLLAAVADLDIWRATVQWWAGRGYKGTNIEGLCERYQANALSAKQAEQPKTASGPYVTADVLAQMEQEFLATLN